jgi:hypothetical protein
MVIVSQVFPKDKLHIFHESTDSRNARIPKEEVLQTTGGKKGTKGKYHFPDHRSNL